MSIMQRISQNILRWEWLILLLILPLTFFPPGKWTALLLLLPVLLLLRRAATGHFFSQTPYDIAILLLMVMLLVSLYATFDIQLSMPKIAGLYVAVFIFYGAVAFTRQRKHGLWYLLTFFFLVGLGMGGIGLLGTTWPSPFSFLNQIKTFIPLAQTGILGTDSIINPNFLAGALLLIAPLFLAAAIGLTPTLWRNHKLFTVLFASSAIFISGLIVATGSRGGIVSLFISILIMLAIQFKWGKWLLIAAGIGAIGLLIYFQQDITTALAQGSDPIGGIEGRLEIWSRAIYGLQDFPFTGMSMNGFRKVVHILYPLFLISPDSDIGHAHNHLLQAGLDLGLPGLISYLALWFISVGLLWKGWQKKHKPEQQILLVGLCGSFTAGWMFGILDSLGLGERPGFVWWLLLAIMVAVFDDIMKTSASRADNDSANGRLPSSPTPTDAHRL